MKSKNELYVRVETVLNQKYLSDKNVILKQTKNHNRKQEILHTFHDYYSNAPMYLKTFSRTKLASCRRIVGIEFIEFVKPERVWVGG